MTIVELLGWVLLHFVWQGAVIALVLGVLLALTREAQARELRSSGTPSSKVALHLLR